MVPPLDEGTCPTSNRPTSSDRWTRPACPSNSSWNDVPDSAREGLHAMAADVNGNLFAVWLDLRSKGEWITDGTSSRSNENEGGSGKEY